MAQVKKSRTFSTLCKRSSISERNLLESHLSEVIHQLVLLDRGLIKESSLNAASASLHAFSKGLKTRAVCIIDLNSYFRNWLKKDESISTVEPNRILNDVELARPGFGYRVDTSGAAVLQAFGL